MFGEDSKYIGKMCIYTYICVYLYTYTRENPEKPHARDANSEDDSRSAEMSK